MSLRRDGIIRERTYIIAATALYCGVAVTWLVLPIIGRFGSALLGTSIFRHDSVLNAGILEWGFRAIFSSQHRLFDWVAGFPLTNTLAVTENLLGWQLLYTPLRLVGVGIPAAYNVLILVSLVISAVGALLLARRLGASRSGAVVAGFVFGFAPFHLSHLLHLQTMGVCWSPFALLFLDRYLENRSPRDAIGLAAAFVMTALCSTYFAVFLAIVLPLYMALCWIFRRYPFDSSAVWGLVATGAVTVATLMPLILHYLQFNASIGYHHPARTLANFSMELSAPLRTPSWLGLWSWRPVARIAEWQSPLTYTPAFPGVTALGLAVLGFFGARRERNGRAIVTTLLVIIVVSFMLALGPLLKPINLDIAPLPSWFPMPGKLWMHIPGIRWPMRIFFFALLAGAVLCGLGVTVLERRVPARWKRAAVIGAMTLIAAEYWPRAWLAGRSASVKDPLAMSDAYPFLAREKDRGGVVELPAAEMPSGWRTPYSTRYIYASSGHLRGIVALHGSVRPPVTDTLLRSADALPDLLAMKRLSAHGVTRVVVHLPLMSREAGTKVIGELRRAGYPIVFEGKEAVVFSTLKSASGTLPSF